MKIYYDTNKIKNALNSEYWGHTAIDLEEWATGNGWYFSQDDIGDCWLSESEDADCFELMEGEY